MSSLRAQGLCLSLLQYFSEEKLAARIQAKTGACRHECTTHAASFLAEMHVVSEAVSVSIIRNKYQTNHLVVEIPAQDIVSFSSFYKLLL
jgi:hypothetical protein